MKTLNSIVTSVVKVTLSEDGFHGDGGQYYGSSPTDSEVYTDLFSLRILKSITGSTLRVYYQSFTSIFLYSLQVNVLNDTVQITVM